MSILAINRRPIWVSNKITALLFYLNEASVVVGVQDLVRNVEAMVTGIVVVPPDVAKEVGTATSVCICPEPEACGNAICKIYLLPVSYFRRTVYNFSNINERLKYKMQSMFG